MAMWKSRSPIDRGLLSIWTLFHEVAFVHKVMGKLTCISQRYGECDAEKSKRNFYVRGFDLFANDNSFLDPTFFVLIIPGTSFFRDRSLRVDGICQRQCRRDECLCDICRKSWEMDKKTKWRYVFKAFSKQVNKATEPSYLNLETLRETKTDIISGINHPASPSKFVHIESQQRLPRRE